MAAPKVTPPPSPKLRFVCFQFLVDLIFSLEKFGQFSVAGLLIVGVGLTTILSNYLKIRGGNFPVAYMAAHSEIDCNFRWLKVRKKNFELFCETKPSIPSIPPILQLIKTASRMSPTAVHEVDTT